MSNAHGRFAGDAGLGDAMGLSSETLLVGFGVARTESGFFAVAVALRDTGDLPERERLMGAGLLA